MAEKGDLNPAIPPLSAGKPLRQTESSHIEAYSADLQRLLGLIFICGVLASSVYLGLYIYTGIWQILAEAGFAALAVGFLGAGYLAARRRKPELAGYLTMFALFIGLGGAELVLSGASLYLTLGAVLLIVLSGSFVLPGKWEIWLTVSVLYTGYAWAVNQYEPIVRYDVGQLPALNIFLPAIIGVVILGIAWQIFRVFKTGTILTQLLISFVSVVAVAVIVIATTTAILDFRKVKELSANKLEAIVALKAEQVVNWQEILALEITSSLLDDDAQASLEHLLSQRLAPAEARQTHDQIQKELQQKVIQEGYFDELFLLDQTGRIVISTATANEGIGQDETEYFQAGLDSFYLGLPRQSELIGQLSVVLARPLRDAEGQTVGVLAARANFDRLNKIMLERTGLGTSGETYLVGINDTLLTPVRSDVQAVGATITRTEGLMTALAEQTSGVKEYKNYRGEAVIGAYLWLPDLQAVLVGEQSQLEASDLAFANLTITVGVSVGAALFAVLAGILITRSITAPLTELAETAQRVARGDLTLQARVRREDEIGLLAQAFNYMTGQIRDLIDSLEDRIQTRTHALETSALISRQLNNILDPDHLLEQIVTKIQEAFDYYHVHIYLIDTEYNDLVMREGTGQVGQQLKAKGHRLRLGQGIVGTVAQNNQPFLAPDVSQVPYFYANPLLPKTRAELAVPVRQGNQVLGVLDLQSEEVGGFGEEDLTLMQSIADQVAVALENARLFQASQAAIAEVESLNARLTHELWESTAQKVEHSGFVYAGEKVMPAAKTWSATMTEAISHKDFVHQLLPPPDALTPSTSTLAIPLLLRGQIIGVIGIERPLDGVVIEPDEMAGWSADELITIQTTSEQIALALDSARLARETERAAWRDRLVSESTAKVWASAEVEAVMRAVIAQLGDKLGASEVIIRLGTEDKLTIT